MKTTRRADLPILFVFGMGVWVSAALATRELSESAFFHRCYAHITGNRTPLDHPALGRLRLSQSTALQECMTLLDKGKLDPTSGQILDTSDEALSVLNNMNRMHNEWFKLRDYSFLGGGSYSHMIQDVGESSLYLTKFLFSDSSYADIVAENRVPLAIRENGANPHMSISRSYFDNGANGSRTSQSPVISTSEASVFIQKGILNGVTWRAGPHVFSPADLINDSSVNQFYKDTINKYSYKTSDHFGGGILGLQSYFTANHATGSAMNGAQRVARRWARAVLSDLLCRDLPVVRLVDIDPNRHIDVSVAQKNAFRSSASCMQCHATIDQMAGTVRNFELRSQMHTFGHGFHVYHVEKLDDTAGSLDINAIKEEDGATRNLAGKVLANSKYTISSPKGELYFRTYDGKLVDIPLNNHLELAQSFANLDDLYVCAARRYFEYFTGIRADLRDMVPEEKQMTTSELQYRNLVIELGLKFKKTKKLRSLVQDIFSTEVYRNSNLRFASGQGSEK